MPASLNTLPPELFENILEYVELRDIHSLRLSGSSLCYLASQDRLKASYVKTTIVLLTGDLQRFRAMTRISALACLVEDLNLITVVPDRSEDDKCEEVCDNSAYGSETTSTICKADYLRQLGRVASRLNFCTKDKSNDPDETTAILSEAFQNIRMQTGRLQSLTLDIALEGWKSSKGENKKHRKRYGSRYVVAAHTFKATMAALAMSRLPVARLDLFENILGALHPDAFAPDVVNDELRPSLQALKDLKVQIFECPRPTNDDEMGISDEQLAAQSATCYQQLPSLIEMPTQLEALDLNFKYIWYNKTGITSSPRAALFKRIAQGRTNYLRRLALSGFTVSCPDLVHVLHKCPIDTLLLYELFLLDGSFARVSEVVRFEMPELQLFRFHSLREGPSRRIVFLGDYYHPRSPALRHMGARVQAPIEFDYEESA